MEGGDVTLNFERGPLTAELFKSLGESDVLFSLLPFLEDIVKLVFRKPTALLH